MSTIAEKTASNAPKADIDALKEKLRLERENAEAALEKLQGLREKTEELRVRVGESAEIKILKQVKANKFVDKFVGSERKDASSELVALYEIDPKSVIDALIGGIILDQSDKRSYRVNLYIAYTLAKLPSKWHGSTEQKKKIDDLRMTRNYVNDKTIKRRIDQAIENYAGT